jgi:DNA-binding transcriptional LysR family regulator
MADRLTGIEVFVLAMRLGSLSAAARSMGMSAAMAAKHLVMLEERLGVTLVHRTTRRLSLTEAGGSYLDKAERILADLREVESEVAARSVAIEGLLRISAPTTFGTAHLAALVAEFGAQHPRLTVELGLNDRYVDLLEERWDVAIRIGRLADSALIARKLVPVRLSLCAAPDYLARRGKPATIEDLARHDCLGYTLAPLVGDSIWGFGLDGDIRVPIRGSLHANNGEALVNAARMGQGIVYGPRFMTATAIAAGELVELDLGTPLLGLGAVYAVTHPTRRPAAKTRAWIDFLVAQIPQISSGW